MENQPIGVCVITVNKDKKILLGKRRNSYKQGMFGLPGGRLNLNESLADCVKRELEEETGREILPGHKAALDIFINPGSFIRDILES